MAHFVSLQLESGGLLGLVLIAQNLLFFCYKQWQTHALVIVAS